MLSQKKLNLIGQLLLLSATFLWGTSFIILKDTLETLPVMFVLAIRFAFSTLALLIIFHKRFKKVGKRTIFIGLGLGGVLSTAYLFQTYGLQGVTPGENAFLTSTYCIMVPFMCWAMFKKRPSFYNVLAGLLCITGIGFVAFYNGSGFSVGQGEILTLISAVFYGIQIIIISRFAKDEDPIVVLALQLFVVAVTCIIGTLLFEVGRMSFTFGKGSILSIAYLTIFCTCIAQLCQIIGQKYTPTSQSSLILSLESVFGLGFSALLGKESFNVLSYVGFGLIFIAIIISETKLGFITKHFKKNKKAVEDIEVIETDNENSTVIEE